MASEIRVNKIENRSGLGTVTFADTGVDLAGIVTATTFSGSGASLTNLPAANVTGTLPAISAANLTNVPAANITGTLPAISGANLTNLPAANLTGSLPAISGANLTGIAATDNVRTGILDVAGISTFRDTVNIPNINGGQIGGRRNLIINGAMQVAQRGSSSTSNGFYSVDRFGVYFTGVDENPTQAQVDVASGTGPYTSGLRKALKITNGNQTGGAGAGDYMYISYKIESQDMAQSGWNYTSTSSFITLSFWVKSSVAQTFYGYLKTADGTGQGYRFETGSLSADTWTKVTVTAPGDSDIQFDTDSAANSIAMGMELVIAPWFGTNYTAQTSDTPLGEWFAYSSGGTRMRDMTSTWYTTNDATFEITGVQLEVGPQATAFEHRSFGEELQLCKRYFNMYSRTHADSGDESIIANGFYWSSSRFMAPLRFDVPMRTNSWSLYKVVGSAYFRIYNNGGGSHAIGDFNLNGQAHVQSAHLNIDSGLSSSGDAGVFFTLDTAARIGFDAEL